MPLLSRSTSILRAPGLLVLAALLGRAAPLTAQGCATVPATGVIAARADTACLSIEQAIARAMGQNPDVRIARANAEMAEAVIKSTLSTAYPKIDGTVTYTRTFDSPYRTTSSSTDTTSGFNPDTTASLADRVRYLEKNSNLDFGSLFGSLPFGQANAYTFAVSGSETIYNGGKSGAVRRISRSYREQAQLQIDEQAAAAELAVRQAYYRALLAQQLEIIAGASVEQATAFFNQVKLLLDAGKSSDLDMMRAEVALDNLRPQAVSAQTTAAVATLELKRLLDLPMAMPLRLTTPLSAPATNQMIEIPVDIAAQLEQRPSVQAQQREVDIQTDNLIVTRAAHRPHLDARMNYGKQIYPDGLFGFGGQSWRTDWTGTLTLSVPIFAGFSKQADMDRERITLDIDRIRLAQLKAGVQLEYQQAIGERERASSAISARQRTVDQAQRVHDLTVLRFDNGLSTQLEVADARLALLQARTNLAQATADLLIADAQVARALGRPSAARSTAR